MTALLKHRCPSCGKMLRIEERHLKRFIRCPGCQHTFEPVDAQESSQHSVELNPAAVSVDTVVNAQLETREDGQNQSSIDRSEQPLRKLGRFELKRVLGQGGFGRVYLAFDPQLERDVALKVLTTGSNSQARVQRFITEAKAAARLKHPNIVPTFESGKEENRYYIASEFIEGRLLSDETMLSSLDQRGVVDCVFKLATALAYAHENSVVHRDIKPQNIIVDAQGDPHLMDFGLARRTDEESNLTTDGAMLGTPAYMSPEQARGDFAKVGPASDQYSLGVILYQLLTGQTPFDGLPHLVVTQVAKGDVPPIRSIRSDVPADVAAVCEKAMQKLQGDRYPSCKEFADDLDAWLNGRSVAARPLNSIQKAIRFIVQHRVIVAMTTITLALFVVFGLSVWHLLTLSNGDRKVVAIDQPPSAQKTTGNETSPEANETVNSGELLKTDEAPRTDNPIEAIAEINVAEPTMSSKDEPAVTTSTPPPEIPPVTIAEKTPSSISDEATKSTTSATDSLPAEIDLLSLIDPAECNVFGNWTRVAEGIRSPKVNSERLQIPFVPDGEYDLVVVVKSLETISNQATDGLTIGLISDGHPFHLLLNYGGWAALEQVDGLGVGETRGSKANASRVKQTQLMGKDISTEIICRVRKSGVEIAVDGNQLINWKGRPDQLSRNGYWTMPIDRSLFVGGFGSYEFNKITLIPISGVGHEIPPHRIASARSLRLASSSLNVPLDVLEEVSNSWSLHANDRLDGELAIDVRPRRVPLLNTDFQSIVKLTCPVELTPAGQDSAKWPDETIRQLTEIPRLRKLTVSNKNSLSANHLTTLSGSHSLQYLLLDHQSLDEPKVADICRIKSLRRLQLNFTNLSDASVSLIADSLPELELLHIGHMGQNSKLTNAAVKSVSQLRKLTDFSIRESPAIDDQCIPDMAKLKTLTSLYIDGTSITQSGYGRLRKLLPNTHITWTPASKK